MTVAVRPEHPVWDRLFMPEQRAFWEENEYVIIGCIPILGWEQFGEEFMAEVAEIVYRFLERRRAGAKPDLTVGSVD